MAVAMEIMLGFMGPVTSDWDMLIGQAHHWASSEGFVKRSVGKRKKIKARENNHVLLLFLTLFSLHVPPLFLDFNEVYIFSDSHKNYVIQREMPLLLLDDFPSERIRGSRHLQWSSVIVLSSWWVSHPEGNKLWKLCLLFFWWARYQSV